MELGKAAALVASSRGADDSYGKPWQTVALDVFPLPTGNRADNRHHSNGCKVYPARCGWGLRSFEVIGLMVSYQDSLLQAGLREDVVGAVGVIQLVNRGKTGILNVMLLAAFYLNLGL